MRATEWCCEARLKTGADPVDLERVTSREGGGTVQLSRTARSVLLLGIAVAVVLVHVVQLVVVSAAGSPARTSVIAVTAVPWVAAALWGALALRRTGTGPVAATALLAVGTTGIAVDGSLTGAPGQVVLCAVGIAGVALGIGLLGSLRSITAAGPVVLGSQVALLLATEGTSPEGWFVTTATVTITVAVLFVASWEHQRRHAVVEELAALARVDPLTGLLNRRGLAEDFPALRSTAPEGLRPAVIAVDLDHFKAVNDALGHDAGDRALVAVSDLLRSQARAGDLVVRLGGEELAWVGTWDDEASAAAAADRLRRAVSEAAMPFGLHLTLSAGVAFSTDPTEDAPHGEALSRLLVRSDAALYRAKAAGRDRVAVAGAATPSRTDPHHDGAPAPQVRDGGSEVSAAGARGAADAGQRA